MEGTYLAMLPPELIEIICSYLNNFDIYNCAQNSNYIRSKLDFSNDNRIDSYLLKSIFKQTSSVQHLTKLNLTGIHWIPAADIRNAIKKLINLHTLFLFDTKMDLTKPNIKVYMEFKKMKVFGLTKKNSNNQVDPAFTQIDFDYFYYHLRKNNNSCRLWTYFNTYYIQAKKTPSYGSDWQKIYNGNWFQNAIDFSTSNMDMKTFDKKYKKSAYIKKIDERCFEGPEENIISKFKSYRKVIHLLIQPNAASSDIRLLRLDPLKYIPNLVKLDIHVMIHLGANFLEPIFANCPNLKFLKIKNENAQMNLIHLKMAQALEDFSYKTAYALNLSRFFMEILENPDLKLRRLYLDYGLGGSQLSLPNLSKFLRYNPQLDCFILVNDITLVEMKQIQEMLDAKITKSCQYFKVMKDVYIPTEGNIVAEDIPICHYDLFDCICEVARHSYRSNNHIFPFSYL